MSVQLQFFEADQRYSRRTSRDRYSRTSSREVVVDNVINPLYLVKMLRNEDAFCGIKGLKQEADPPQTLLRDIRIGLTKTFKFAFRFVAIMGVLYLSAIIFAYFEDPSIHGHPTCKHPQKANGKNSTRNGTDRYDVLHTVLEKVYNFSHCDVESISIYVKMVEGRNGKIMETNHRGFNHNNIQKWFYFVIIATTTIGYGDVYPQTHNGKIFYCCFSVIGIILMMSLLKSCGAVLTGINTRFYQLVRTYKCPGTACWSDEFLSVISMTFLFVIYLSLGIWHDTLAKSDKHSLVDIIYFWIVSFTTVGFGDIGHPLEFEIKHAYELTVYRVFGLSLVAAIIESIKAYIALREETLRHETMEKQKKLLEKLQASLINTSPFITRRAIREDTEYGVIHALRDVVTSLSYEDNDVI